MFSSLGILKKTSSEQYQLTLGDVNVNAIVAEPKESTPLQNIKPMSICSGFSSLCYISYIDSLQEFYVQPVEQLPDLDQIVNKMTDIGENESSYPSLSSYPVGSCCCAKYSSDGFWYRAEILSEVDRNYQVKFRLIMAITPKMDYEV